MTRGEQTALKADMFFGWRPKLEKRTSTNTQQQPKYAIPISLKYAREPCPHTELVPYKNNKQSVFVEPRLIYTGFRPTSSLQIHEVYKSDLAFPPTYQRG